MRKKYNIKMNVRDGEYLTKLRIYHQKQKGKHSPRFLIKCGCCESSVAIYYDSDSIEINGVLASLEEWGRVLLPILK